jgi:3-polyprenyl-4-hydroxybenzoate decarboxylase
MYKDLREFIELVEKLGALRRIEGADPRFEIGGITEIAAGRSGGPAFCSTRSRAFPGGFRIFTNATTSPLAWIGQFPPTSALSLAEARAIEEKVGSGAEVIPMTLIIGTSCPAMTVRIGERADLVTPPRWPN